MQPSMAGQWKDTTLSAPSSGKWSRLSTSMRMEQTKSLNGRGGKLRMNVLLLILVFTNNMNEEKALLIQNEIRNEASELRDYLSDLKQWETDIKRRDRELQQKGGVKEEHHMQPVRTTKTSSMKQSKNSSTPKLPEKKKCRLSSYDYSSWDKFDAEKECENIDREPNDDDKNNDLEIAILKKKQQAEIEKEKGNAYLKANKLDDAITCYTKGITLDPENQLIPANRALAYLKKEQFSAAEEDCNVALKLDPRYVKAYLRRATARLALKKLFLAKDDLQEVLKFEPNNSQAKQELQKLKQMTSENLVEASSRKTTPSQTNANLDDDSVVHAIDKPPHLRSKKSLCRIKVTEVLDNGDTNANIFDKEIKSNRKIDSTNEASVATRPTVDISIPTVNQSELTSYQFQRDFRRLKSYSESLYKYLKQIPPSIYPRLFQHSLEPGVVTKLLCFYRDCYLSTNEDIYPYLLNLSKIKRFSMLSMFLSKEDKEILHGLIKNVESLQNHSQDEVQMLYNVYGL